MASIGPLEEAAHLAARASDHMPGSLSRLCFRKRRELIASLLYKQKLTAVINDTKYILAVHD